MTELEVEARVYSIRDVRTSRTAEPNSEGDVQFCLKFYNVRNVNACF